MLRGTVCWMYWLIVISKEHRGKLYVLFLTVNLKSLVLKSRMKSQQYSYYAEWDSKINLEYILEVTRPAYE